MKTLLLKNKMNEFIITLGSTVCCTIAIYFSHIKPHFYFDGLLLEFVCVHGNTRWWFFWQAVKCLWRSECQSSSGDEVDVFAYHGVFNMCVLNESTSFIHIDAWNMQTSYLVSYLFTDSRSHHSLIRCTSILFIY